MYKCQICGKKYTELSSLYNHIESIHKEMIPKDMSVQQYYYYMKTGKTNGNCVMCKHPTTWNEKTNKYNRFCSNPKCKEEYAKIMKSRMIAKYGKAHLLNDPNKQREMLANRSISGVYEWRDGKTETTYTGSYELDFLKTMDDFFEWDPSDIMMPSPHTYTYKYEGEDKFYIPDVFIPSLNLEIEIKDGGDNPNNHHKIQAVDKEKEKLKDEVLMTQKNFHYVKLTNKNFTNFFDFMKEYKKGFEKFGDENKIPRIFKVEDIRTKPDPNVLKESTEIIEEGVKFKNYERIWVSTDWHFYKNKDGQQFKTSKHIKEILNNYKKCVKNNDTFIFLGDLYDARSIFDMRLVPEIFKIKDLKGYKIMIKGNHDVNTTEFYLNLGFDEVYDTTYRIGNIVFSHEPVGVTNNEINIHGHIHFSNNYWDVSPVNHLDAYIGHYDFKPVLISTIINEYRGTERISHEAIERFDNCILESFNAIEEGLINDALYKLDNVTFAQNKSLIYRNYDQAKKSPKELQKYINRLIKAAKFEEDLEFIDRLVKHSSDDYYNILKHKPELKDEYNEYIAWIRDPGCYDKKVKIQRRELKESTEYVEEIYKPKDLYVNFDKFESGESNICLITGLSGSGKSTLSNEICKEHNALCIEMDIFEHPDMEYDKSVKRPENLYYNYFNKNKQLRQDLMENNLSNKELADEMNKFLNYVLEYCTEHKESKFVIEGLQIFADIDPKYIKSLPIIFVNTPMITSMIRKVKRDQVRYNLIEMFKWYMDDEKKYRNFKEEILKEKFEPDKFLVWFDKPIQKAMGKKIRLYHGTIERIKGKRIDNISANVGATKFSDPRWSTYFWDNREDAMKWASAWAIVRAVSGARADYLGHNGKTLVVKPEGMSDKAFSKYLQDAVTEFYIYEVEVDIADLEIGSCPTVREYTVSKPVDIIKEYKYLLNHEIIRRCVEFVSEEEFEQHRKKYGFIKDMPLHRGPILNHVLKTGRDPYRGIIRTDVRNGNLKPGDDLTSYKYSINYHFKNDSYGFFQESSISYSHLNYCLQQETDELLKKYLDDYTDFYYDMISEKPEAEKHINEDIKKAIKYIDDLSEKEDINNDMLYTAKWCLGDLVGLNKHSKPNKHSKHTQSLRESSITLEAVAKDGKRTVWVGADWHFYTKYNDNLKENPNIDKIINNFNKVIKPNDIVIFLGDLYDARRIHDKKEMPNLKKIKRLKGYKIFVKGNHDVDPDKAYYDLGFNEVHMKYILGNVVFTHEPVNVDKNQVNVHGHLHYCGDYWYIKPKSHIDVYTARFKYQPVSLTDAVTNYNDGVILPEALDNFKATFGEHSTYESYNSFNIKLVYEEGTRRIFSMNDINSKIIINERYVLQKDKIGVKYNISPMEIDYSDKQVIEFNIVCSEAIELDYFMIDKHDVVINSLYNDNSLDFIKETCNKLFGFCPEIYKLSK